MSLIIFPVVSLCFVSLKIVYFMYCCSLFIGFLIFFSFPSFGEWIYLLSLLRFLDYFLSLSFIIMFSVKYLICPVSFCKCATRKINEIKLIYHMMTQSKRVFMSVQCHDPFVIVKCLYEKQFHQHDIFVLSGKM